MSATEPRYPGLLRAIAEPMLALAGAFAITILFTLPFIPSREQLEVPLRPQVGADATPHAELEERVAELDSVEEARVLLVRGVSRLVMDGVTDADRTEFLVADILNGAGYQRDEFVRRPVPDVEALLGAPRLPLVMTIQTFVFSAVGLALARGRVGATPSATRRGTQMSHPRAALIGVAAGVGAVVMSAVVGKLLELAGLPVEEQAWLEQLFRDREALFRIAPWIVLIVPASEEIFFRFYVFRFVRHHAGFPAGLLVSSMLFAMTHFNPSGFLIYLGIGCILAWAYQRTGRLTAAIAGHVTLNGVVLLASQVVTDLGV